MKNYDWSYITTKVKAKFILKIIIARGQKRQFLSIPYNQRDAKVFEFYSLSNEGMQYYAIRVPIMNRAKLHESMYMLFYEEPSSRPISKSSLILEI